MFVPSLSDHLPIIVKVSPETFPSSLGRSIATHSVSIPSYPKFFWQSENPTSGLWPPKLLQPFAEAISSHRLDTERRGLENEWCHPFVFFLPSFSLPLPSLFPVRPGFGLRFSVLWKK